MKNNSKPILKALLFFMKVTVIQMLIICASAMLGYAVDTRGQEILEKKVSLPTGETGLKDLLSIIEGQTNVKFTYRSRVIRDYHKITINTTNMKLGELLDEVLDPSINYEVIGKQIILKTATVADVTVSVSEESSKLQNQITGVVTDDAGAAMPGVNVLVKGTSNGTSTDTDGRYALQVEDQNSILVFSFIGYSTQEITVGTQTTINVSMVADIKALQEVVVVGYGEQKKLTVTGSVVAVAGNDLIKSPAIDLSNSLAGRLAGVSAVQASGEPGQDNSTIRIRGVGSLGGSNALIVIDGIPDRDGGFGRLSPQDIESTTVLKDASAAIYGARAANGVILITTKRGKAGTPKITYDFNQGWAQPTRIPKMASASEYAAIMNEFPVYGLPVGEWSAAWSALQNTGTYTALDGTTKKDAVFSPTDVQKYKDGSDPWGHPNTDWFGTAFKKWSPQSRHNIQLSGGSESVKYLASAGYVSQDAYYKNSATKYEQYNFRINVDGKVNKYINTSLGLMAREELRKYPTQSAGDIFRMLMRGRPTDPEVWPNGLPGPDIENGQNPIVVTTNATGYEKNPTDYLQSNGKIEITNPWIEGLKLTVMGSADKSINRDKKWETPWYLYTWDKKTYEADGVTPKLTKALRSTFTDPRLTQYTRSVFNTNATFLLNYDRTFADNHSFGLMVGTTREKFTGDAYQAYRRDYISSVIDQPFAGGTTQLITGGNDNRYTYNRARIGYYGRLTYNYKEKYLAEFVWRRDGSSIFPPGHQYGFFPGLLVGWNLSNESFLQNVSFINFLKVRASYGEMGNDQVYFRDANNNFNLQEYAYLSAYSLGSYPINGQTATTSYEPVVPNPNFTWERAKNSNIGLDGTFFGGKVDLTLEYFYNKRDHILIQKQGSTPASSGITTLLPPVNAGRVDNKGFEFRIGYNNQISGLKYTLGANGGYAQNKVMFMDETPGIPSYQRQTGKPFSAQTGTSASYLVYKYDGVFKSAEDIASNTIDYSGVTSQLRPGDMKFKDVNHDGKITADDQVRLNKTVTPKFTYGISMNFQYGKFDLSILFQGATGGLLRFGTESGDIGNYLKYSYDHRWTVDHPSSKDPRLASRGDTYYTGGNYGNNTYNYFNTNYLRLKNAEIGFTVPESLLKKGGLTALRVYVNGLNLITWDKFKIWDPESVSGSGQYYPQARVINAGFRLTF